MRFAITSEASALHGALTADLRTITTAMAGGFTTEGGLHQALAAISRLQDQLPQLRRELRAIRAQVRQVA